MSVTQPSPIPTGAGLVRKRGEMHDERERGVHCDPKLCRVDKAMEMFSK